MILFFGNFLNWLEKLISENLIYAPIYILHTLFG